MGITIPDGVTQIGYAAFRFCSSLSSITIPDGVTQIGDYTFEGCTELETADCKAVEPPLLGVDVFMDCEALATINVPTASVDAYKAADGWREYESLIQGKDF